MQYTSNRNHIQEVYKRYLLRTFDGILIRGSRSDKKKKIIFVRHPFHFHYICACDTTPTEIIFKKLIKTFDENL
jgi:hypothetical protein